MPVLIDGEINGQKRKLVAQASRNGYFFVLDRTNGQEHSRPRSSSKRTGQRVSTPKVSRFPIRPKSRRLDGALVTPNQARRRQLAAAELQSRKPACFTSTPRDAYSVYYIYDTSEKPEGWGGNDRGGWSKSTLKALDYKTGKLKWEHKWEGTGGPVRACCQRPATWCLPATR